MMPPPPSLTDASSASMTVGARTSGLNLSGDRSLPSFLVGRMQAEPTPVQSATQPIPYISPWWVVGAVAAFAAAIAWARS